MCRTTAQTGHKRPVMIMIHGGGWRNGDKASPPIVGAKMRHFVGQGYVYASINYRLSSQTTEPNGVQHPTHAMDCAKAVAWIHDHVAEYGGDPARMHLMGHSAGGHLAAILGTNDRFLKKHGKDLSILKSNVLLDPAAIDIPRYIELESGRAMTALYELAFGKDPANWRDASPQQHVAPGKHIPPTLLFYAGDRMKLNVLAPAFVEALTKAGASSAAVDTITLDHGQINSHIGMVNEPMTALIMRLHAGEDATAFPKTIDGQSSAQAASAPTTACQPNPALAAAVHLHARLLASHSVDLQRDAKHQMTMKTNLHHSITPLLLCSLSVLCGATAHAQDARFKRFDKDGDGKVSRDEAKGTAAEVRFDELDKNKDGFLTPDEVPRGRTAEAGKRGTCHRHRIWTFAMPRCRRVWMRTCSRSTFMRRRMRRTCRS